MTSLCLVGCGKMGRALLDGCIKADLYDDIFIVDPQTSPADISNAEADILDGPEDIEINPDIIIFAVKPQILPEVAKAYAGFKEALFISIAAGISIETIQQALGFKARLVRAMPNTPASIGKGVTVLYPSRSCNDADLQLTTTLMSVCGPVHWVDDEHQMHAVTALSGSGPAYVFHMIESLAHAGAELGLDGDLAMRLARQTVIGSAALVDAQFDASPAELRQAVTSPNGTTQAGLDVLMDAEKGLSTLMSKTLRAAKNRSIELSEG